MKKKILIIAGAAVIVIALIAAGILFLPKLIKGGNQGASEGIYVDQVSIITGVGMNDNIHFSGVIETEKPVDVKLDITKQLKEILVQEGQTVKEGDPLFTYDVDSMDLKLRQAEIEYDSIDNKIETLKAQVETLTKEKEKASKDLQLKYSLEIQGIELDIRTEEYNKIVKNDEIESLKESIENATVFSEISGVISTVKEPERVGEDGSNVLIQITGNLEYKVKCKVSEMNMGAIYEGMPVSVVSRVNADSTWDGVISMIDMNPVSDDNMNGYYYEGSDTMTQASKYNFYITMENVDGLMLGQHVYVQPMMAGQKAGMWMPSFYMGDPDTDPYVYVENAAGVIEKRSISLGEYDPDTNSWEVLDGLTAEEFIAFPDESVQPGMKALHYSEQFGE